MELRHATAVTLNIVAVVFEAARPRIQFLVQTVEPVRALASLIISQTA